MVFQKSFFQVFGILHSCYLKRTVSSLLHPEQDYAAVSVRK